MRPQPVAVDRWRGSAAAFHGREVPPIDAARLWWFEVERPALVLGSTQPDDVVDRAAAARAGVEVVRRRSGGGAVLLVPGDVTWVDVLLPRADPRWSDDDLRDLGEIPGSAFEAITTGEVVPQ